MKLHSCKVRLKGNVSDEVRKIGVTSAEIRVLKRIHGEDAVVEIEATGSANRTESQERERLEKFYGEAIINAMYGAKVQTIEDEIEPATIAEEGDTDPKPMPVATRTKTLEPAGVAAMLE